VALSKAVSARTSRPSDIDGSALGAASETLARVAVKNGSANLRHAMRAFERPLHLLLFDHSPGNKGAIRQPDR
jgi:hypothetical protein